MNDLLLSLAEGVVIPTATALAARYWKSSSKPARESGEDKLLAFEFLLAAMTIVLIDLLQALKVLLSGKYDPYPRFASLLAIDITIRFALILALVMTLMVFAYWVKNKGWREANDASLHRSTFIEPVWELPPGVAASVNWRAAWILAACWLISWATWPVVSRLWG